MRIPLYQVDAFTRRVFGGNPAAICPLEAWLPDATMQAIAAENNLAETAFIVPDGEDFGLRWFTPAVEVDLCGHATLATAHLLLTRLEPARGEVRFQTRSGLLTVKRDGERLVMDFPSRPAAAAPPAPGLLEALGRRPAAVLLSARAKNYLLVYNSADEVRALRPDFAALARIEGHGIIVTAAGSDGVDFVSRYFAAWHGIPEDPVTGSAHCTLTPYWAKRLGKRDLVAQQVSPRCGELFVSERGERVMIGGYCAFYLEGVIEI
ncbi:MAG TPA: PhzF family phenazine biosynthesis protein [Candidatus Sulfotelmatobacter sp.]|nr:PhzF family phenazine biosynthesis protein [Candidatus Sulfotelmatobacter sp.]